MTTPNHQNYNLSRAGSTRIEDITRREFISSAFAAALLIACGDDDDESPAETTRTITTKYGTYQIPVEPQRLVLMESRIELEAATAMGLKAIAIGKNHEYTGGSHRYVAPYIPYTVTDEHFFEAREVDIEELLNLKPDLIFGEAFFLDLEDVVGSYENLSRVAPVVPIGATAGLSWRRSLEEVAGWLGRESQLNKTLGEYDALRESIKQKHEARISSASVAVGYPDGEQFWLLTTRATDWPTSDTLVDLGGRTSELPEDPDNAGWIKLSMENLRMLDRADAMLVYVTSDESRVALEANPLWSLLDVVKNNRVVLSPHNVGAGSVYTYMEALRLWDQVYSTLV